MECINQDNHDERVTENRMLGGVTWIKGRRTQDSNMTACYVKTFELQSSEP
jgi:hypothetical protein